MAIFNINKDLLGSDVTVIEQSFENTFKAKVGPQPENITRMTFRNLVNTDGTKYPDVELLIDPNAITINKNVMNNKTLTKGGWVVQFWGHDFTSIGVSANTGNFQPLYGVPFTIPRTRDKKDLSEWGPQLIARWSKGGGPLKVFEKLKQYVYMNRFDFKEPYKGNPIINLYWEDYVYEGYFTNFTYNLTASDPFQIAYNFNFMAIKRRDMSAADLFGSTDIKGLISNPQAFLASKTKQITSVGASWVKKEATKLINSTEIGQKINSVFDIVDDLPDKMTLW